MRDMSLVLLILSLVILVAGLTLILSIGYDTEESGPGSFSDLGGTSSDFQLSPISQAEYPLVLVHGFTKDADDFISMSTRFVNDGFYTDGGKFTPENSACYTISNVDDKQPVIRATYYVHYEDALQYTSIDDLVNRLSKVITNVKKCTGKEKVDIVAHSMGGLVAQEFISRDKYSSVNKLILLATPQDSDSLYGVSSLLQNMCVGSASAKGFSIVEEVSNVIVAIMRDSPGVKYTRQCVDIDSSKNNKIIINAADSLVDYHTIAGLVDNKGDKMVKKDGTIIDGAKSNDVVKCTHREIINPSLCPEGYGYILSDLGLI